MENTNVNGTSGSAIDAKGDNVEVKDSSVSNTGEGIKAEATNGNVLVDNVTADSVKEGPAISASGDNVTVSDADLTNVQDGIKANANNTANINNVNVDAGNGTAVDVTANNANVNNLNLTNTNGTAVKSNATNNNISDVAAKGGNVSPGDAGNMTYTNQTVSPDSIKVPSSDSKNPVFEIDIPGGDATGTLQVLDENGKVIAESPVTNGKSSVTVNGLTPGKHSLSIVYSGDAKYAGVKVNASVNIPQDTPKPAVKKATIFSVKKKVTFKKSKRSKTKSIKFKLLSGKSKLSNKKVYFKLDKNALKSIKAKKGKKAKKAKKILNQLKKGTYVVKTKKGVATLKLSNSYFTFKKLKKGKITAKFKGDNSYKATAKTITLVMK